MKEELSSALCMMVKYHFTDEKEIRRLLTMITESLSEKNQERLPYTEYLQNQITERDNTIAERDNTIAEIRKALDKKDNTIAEIRKTLDKKENTIAEMDKKIKRLKAKRIGNFRKTVEGVSVKKDRNWSVFGVFQI